MRDLIILLVHLIATLARLMGPGGLRSVVAESLLVKHQLLILKRSRDRAPESPCVGSDPCRRVCAVHAPRPCGPLGDRAQTVDDPELPSNVAQPEVPMAVFTEAAPHRTQRSVQNAGGSHRRDEAAQPHVGLSADRTTGRPRLCRRYR